MDLTVELLEKLKHVSEFTDFCAECGELPTRGHSNDCALQELIARAEAQLGVKA